MAPDTNEKRDWRISLVLLTVWAVAMFLVWRERSGIPLSMMAIATVFFVFLIPAMNDLVRSIERRVLGQGAGSRNNNRQN